MPDDKRGESEFYVEFVSIGINLKVTAIDPESGTEVSMIGAPQLSRDALAKLAVRKLKYVLAKEASSSAPDEAQ